VGGIQSSSCPGNHQTYLHAPGCHDYRSDAQQLQALALQPAVWGISCLVLLPSSCNDSSLYLSFSNNCKATAVAHTKRIDRNLLRKETSFVYVAHLQSCVKVDIWSKKKKLRTVARIKTQDYKNWAQAVIGQKLLSSLLLIQLLSTRSPILPKWKSLNTYVRFM